MSPPRKRGSSKLDSRFRGNDKTTRGTNSKNSIRLGGPIFWASVVLVLWFCSAVDVMTFMPKRALQSLKRAQLSADEKLFELWGGSYKASVQLTEKKLLGAKVGVPDQAYAENNGLTAPYGHNNYAALLYPGRMVVIDRPEDLETLAPDFLILDKSWPEFTFPGDPRPADRRLVESPELVRIIHG